MSSISTAKTAAIDWARDDDNADGWVGEYTSAQQAADIAAGLKADGYEVSRSDDSSDHDDGIARRWWVWVIVPRATTKQLQALRTEAGAAGDIATRILCDMAMDGEDSRYDADCLDADGRPDYSGGGHSAHELSCIRDALRMTSEQALAECERIIDEAA